METALVALVAGALGAGITGLLQLRRDRVETLRQRQLDAADAFASAASRVLLSIKLMLESYPQDEERRERWREEARQTRDSLLEEVRDVAAHTPRIELLFGVESPAAVAAIHTTTDLSHAATNLQPPADEKVFAVAYELAAASALRFHDEAHQVVVSSWWRRHRHKPIPDDSDEVIAEHLKAEYGITDDD